jgi:hypothetical protein
MCEIKRYTLQEVADFINGEGRLDGYYFGEFPPRKPYFWRKYLRIAMDDHLAATKQAKIDAVRLLDAALCPCCDKSGAYYDNYGEVRQCQWCYEVEQLKEQRK